MKLSKLLSLFEDDKNSKKDSNERSAGEEAKAKGLEDLKFGRYGKNGQVTHIAKDGKLVPYDPSKDDNAEQPTSDTPSKPTQVGPKLNDPEYTRSRVQSMAPADQKSRRDQLARMGQPEFPDTPEFTDQDVSYLNQLIKKWSGVDGAVRWLDGIINDPKNFYHKGDAKALQALNNRKQQLLALKQNPDLLKKVQDYTSQPAKATPEERAGEIEATANKYIADAGGDVEKALDFARGRWSHYDKEYIRRSSNRSLRDKAPYQLAAAASMRQFFSDVISVLKKKQTPTTSTPTPTPATPAQNVGTPEELHPEAVSVANLYKMQYGSVEEAEAMLRRTISSLQGIVKIMKTRGTGKNTQKYKKALEQEKKFLDALKILLSNSDKVDNPKMGNMIPQQSVDPHKENMKQLERLAHTTSRGGSKMNSAEKVLEVGEALDKLRESSPLYNDYEELVSQYLTIAKTGDPFADKSFQKSWADFLFNLRDEELSGEGPYSADDEPGFDHDPDVDDYKHFGPDN